MPQLSLGNGYTIDLADGWTFVHALEDALQQMQAGFTQNVQGRRIDAPGNDTHSRTFSSGMTTKAIQLHQEWYDTKVAQFRGMIQNVTGILNQYQIAETANTIQWADAPTYDPNSSSDIPRGHGAV
jgi:hypothetical protein